jgi:protein FRA10AC1
VVEAGLFCKMAEDGYTKHCRIMRSYVHYNGERKMKAQTQRLDDSAKTDLDVLHEQHQFIRDEEDDSKNKSWERRMTAKYYQRLFKEYALADLTRYKEGKVGLRWRTEKEVMAGKGQFTCGNKRCDAQHELHSYELNFSYKENGERKRALVKVRACPVCATKLFHEKIQRVKAEEKKRRKQQRKERKKRKKLEADGEYSRTETDTGLNSDSDESEGNAHDMIARMNRRKEGDNSDGTGRSLPPGLQQSAKQATEEAKDADWGAPPAAASSSSVWSAPAEQEKTKDDEYEDFFCGLFL